MSYYLNMKKILLIVYLTFCFTIFSQTLTFSTGHFSNKEENLIFKKDFNLFKRSYDSEIDKDFKIDKIDITSRSTRAEITFNNKTYTAKYYMYPESEQTIYLFKIKDLGNFSLTLTREGQKIRYIYMIPNKGLFSKEALRDMPEEDKLFLMENGFNETDIDGVNLSNRYTIFYTGYVKFN